MSDKLKTEGDRVKRTLKFVQILLDISNDLASSDSLDDALEKLVAITTKTIGAERGTIFLNDKRTDELYSRFLKNSLPYEIRIENNLGIAGWVFTNGDSSIINDAYADERFNKNIDKKTGFKTRNILCTPIRTTKGELIGVSQILNKNNGDFNESDLDLLEAMTDQASIAIQKNLIIKEMEESRKQELEFLDVVTKVSSELNLAPLLEIIISTISKMLHAERSTLFLNDETNKELFAELGEGLERSCIRFGNHLGIAGAAFTSGKTVNIRHAYADLRFNPAFDRQTGFFTRSVLCMPVRNKHGKIIGVTQVLNKRGGPFGEEDEARLAAFTSQISIAIENAKLFEDVQNIKNYNESMLQSMSNGLITIDETGKITTCNRSAMHILKLKQAEHILNVPVQKFFVGNNKWIAEKVLKSSEEHNHEELLDAELFINSEKHSVNINILPLISSANKKLGSMLIFEDISKEKRMKSTISRYMDATLTDKLLGDKEDVLGGSLRVVTILFSDIRSFTTLSEDIGPQETVHLLNEYFTLMVDCIQDEGGILDKFIGDAIMALFGIPFSHQDDPDRAVRTALAMMHRLNLFNQKRVQENKKPIKHSIGLHTDTVISGNIGSPKRMDYTVIGDGVNLAARLESACKQYGVEILISESTLSKLKGHYQTREIDRVVMKGKSHPVAIYEVLDHHTPQTFPNIHEVIEQFNKGITTYKQRNWDAAITHFQNSLELHPQDPCATVYLERCEKLKAKPPGKEWNGTWVMVDK